MRGHYILSKKADTRMGIGFGGGLARDSLPLLSQWLARDSLHYSVAAVKPAASNGPLDRCF